MTGIGGGSAGISQSGAFVMQQLRDTLVFRDENIFSLSKRFPIPLSGVVHIVFDPTALNSPGNVLAIFPLFFQSFGAGPVEIDIYFGTDADEDGTEILCFNRNQESSKDCLSRVWLNPTINDIGTKLPPEFEIPSDGTPATAVLGGSAGDTIITNAMKTGKYTFRLTNTEANAARGVVAINWLEFIAPVP